MVNTTFHLLIVKKTFLLAFIWLIAISMSVVASRQANSFNKKKKKKYRISF